jgi:two-component system cell cycle sensor histidine kinase/response regulator CckA
MPGGSTGTILVADDEEMLLRLVDNVLRRAGFRVVTATTGTEALEAFSEDPAAIDTVLIDAGVPPSGAAEVLRSMLALRSGVGVVVSSGASPSDELQELLADCGGHFLSKPFDPETLISVVSAIGHPIGHPGRD